MKKIICRDLKNKEYEVSAEKLIWKPSVYGVLIENNKILLSKQWDGYDFPGGKIEINETVEDALIREYKEETGLNVEVLNPVYVETSFFYPNYSKKYKNEYWNCPLVYFIVKMMGGKLSVDGFDDDEKKYADFPEWIDLDKVKDIKFYNSADSLKILDESKKLLKL